ncbi:MAG: hypothetical protein QOE70_6709 [Chthoniobacter sp.]|jgi:Tfp pilus assembly protein PilV|nr:hypothetical protein [Chthoniobacter sp.]
MKAYSKSAHRRGLTIIEVLVATLVILVGLCSILAMNARSMHTLRSTRQAAASSQMLQQRIETLRSKAWPEISNSTALATLMKTATESEAELGDPALLEWITVSVPDTTTGSVLGDRSFSVRRQRGNVRIEEAGDLGSEPTLLIDTSITWRDMDGSHERQLRTILCRAGLTRSGIFGSALGRPRSDAMATSAPVPGPSSSLGSTFSH